MASTGEYDLRSIAHEAMSQHGLLPDFSEAALAEARKIAGAAVAAGEEVRDLRHLLWASIDNDDSRDLDQLSVAQPLAPGSVKILVAIADVDALVGKNSAIDDHARSNTTSVYTPARIFPMLPERLSTDLTSLERARSDWRSSSTLRSAKMARRSPAMSIGRTVLNRAKLAYNSVAAWLEGTGPAPAK